MKNSILRWLFLLILGCSSSAGLQAQSVIIDGLSPIGEYQGDWLYVVEDSSITVRTSSGVFDYIYIDGVRKAYNSDAWWESYSLEISNYMDGEIHKLKLKYSENSAYAVGYDYTICYFGNSDAIMKINGEYDAFNDEDGIFYSVSDNEAKVFGSLSNIETANIRSSITRNGVNYPVTTISSYAFFERVNLREVTIPESIATIGEGAFTGCDSLTTLYYNAINCTRFDTGFPKSISTLTIGNGVTTIPSYFMKNGCEIESLTFPSSLISIGYCAFSCISKLTTIEIPEQVTSIDRGAFKGCNSLKTLTFNAVNCTSCGSSYEPSFPSSISSLTIGEGVTKIPSYFLYSGSEIESLTLPASLTLIGDYAFKNCAKLSSIEIPEKVNWIGNSAFSGSRDLTTLLFNATSCTVNASSFPSSISKLEIGNGVTEIPSNFLYGCKGLKRVSIPNGVTSIGDNAFYSCTNLVSLTLGTGLLNIGNNAFSYTSSSTSISNITIAKVFWLGNTPPSGTNEIRASVNYVSNDQYSLSNKVKYQFLSSMFLVDGTYYVPVSPSERTCVAVDSDYSLENGDIVIGNKVTNRGVELSVIDINKFTYYKNHGITSLTVNNSGEIGNSAFSGCEALNDVTIGENITAIGSSAFESCSSLQSISLPDNLISIGTYSFYGCSRLENAEIGSGIGSIPQYAFGNCSSLNNLSIPNNVTSIGDYVFSGCSSLANITIEDGVESLRLWSNGSKPLFADCPLDEVYLGRKLSYNTASNYGYSPFYRNSTLRSVNITDEETQIYDNEFYGCTNLKTLKIGNGVQTIGNWAFSGCSSLEYFSAGSEVKSIGKEAFSDCTGMTNYYSFSVTPPTCGSQALDDINKWDCTLHVPAESSDEYMAADQWKEFFFINEPYAVIAESISFNIKTLEGLTGETFQLVAEFTPANVTRKTLAWESSNPAVASVDSEGLVSFLSEGEAVISAMTLDGSGVEASIDVIVRVKEPELGDSNANGSVNIADVVNIANYAIGNEVEHFNQAASDVNKDGKITMADATGTVRIILEQDVVAQSAAARVKGLAEGDVLIVEDFEAEVGGVVSLGVSLDDSMDYVALQADVVVPEGMALIDVKLGERAEGTHSLTVRRIDSRTMRIALFDLENRAFAGRDEALLALEVRVDAQPMGAVQLINAIAADNQANEYALTSRGGQSADMSGIEAAEGGKVRIETSTGVISVYNAEGMEVCIYAVDGTMITRFTSASDMETRRVSGGVYVVAVGAEVEKVVVK